MESKRYIFSTESLNRNGYRVMTGGIQIENFQKNPILLFNHDLEKVAIGMVKELRVENNMLTGIPVFDTNTEEGAKYAAKMESGFPLAFSVRVDPKKESAAAKDLVPGQTLPTVMESELLELSVVNIPGNQDSVLLLSMETSRPLQKITPIQKKLSMEKSTKALGLSENATDEEIFRAVQALQLQVAAAQEANAKAACDLVLQLGESRGMVTTANRETYKKLAMSDPDSLKAIFESAPAQVPEKPATANEAPRNGTHKTLAAQLKPTGTAATDAEETFDILQRKNPARLLEIKQNDPEKYAALCLAYKTK